MKATHNSKINLIRLTFHPELPKKIETLDQPKYILMK